MMKYEWRKKDKETYLPKNKPTVYHDIEKLFITIDGKGNPNNENFKERVEFLFALSYGIRMMPKSSFTPEGYYEYTVFPLEGRWDLNEEGRKLDYLSKDHFVYKLMIRQPEFVTEEIFQSVLEKVRIKKSIPNHLEAQLEKVSDGLCVQMMHLGSYDDEPKSFEIMENFCKENGLKRIEKQHKEIYISDPRKTEPDKLKTVLRIKVE